MQECQRMEEGDTLVVLVRPGGHKTWKGFAYLVDRQFGMAR
jgi:hypothetical protein